MRATITTAILGVALAAGCGSSDDGAFDGSAAGASGSAAGGSGGSGAGAAGGAGAVGTGGAAGGVGGGGASAGTGGGGGQAGQAPVSDPGSPGPLATQPLDVQVSVSKTGSDFATRCYLPVGGSAPHPLVVIAHGFQLPASQYYGYAERLASFGFVACSADYPAGFTPNNVRQAEDLLGVVDFVQAESQDAQSPFAGLVDPEQIGMAGHSLGGKLSVLAASMDPRVDAVLGLDPVDSAMLCNAQDCPDASDKLPLPIPTAFLGETLDATAGLGGQACAPAADNYQTFFESAATPSIEVTLQGANHMSFLDDPSSCGLTCSFCKDATMPDADALEIAYWYAVAFFQRHLRGNAAYDEYLTGATAQQRFVATGKIALRTK